MLVASGVRKDFGALAALDGVDLELGPGDAVGIVGPNGAGKTTLLNVLAGTMRASGGQVSFAGHDVTHMRADARARLGIGRAHQIPRPFGGMTVFENCLVGASTGGGLRRREAYRRCLDVLDVTGMSELADRRADTLGLPERKRLELARAMATGPRLLLLDEIGAGLTDAEAMELIALIKRLNVEDGIAVIWIEHVVHVLVQGVRRLICMVSGQVLADGEPRAVLSDQRVIDAYLGSAAA
ncbi:MAG: ABC transporter ATP-binding protein [Solirubrobacteraceae bacterium]